MSALVTVPFVYKVLPTKGHDLYELEVQVPPNVKSFLYAQLIAWKYSKATRGLLPSTEWLSEVMILKRKMGLRWDNLDPQDIIAAVDAPGVMAGITAASGYGISMLMPLIVTLTRFGAADYAGEMFLRIQSKVALSGWGIVIGGQFVYDVDVDPLAALLST